uniref:Uncharacterized protein n=1 Tax=Anopheles maculatus TaxID=74869 RepID=A0A182SEL9_9DIPT
MRHGHERRKSSLLEQEQHYNSSIIGGVGSISLAVGTNSDSSQQRLVNGKGSEATAAPNDNSDGAEVTSDSCTTTNASTGDSNGCDFNSDSHDCDRKLSNQSTQALAGGDSLPKDRPDYRHHQHPPESTLESDRGGGVGVGVERSAQSSLSQNSNFNSSNANYNKLKANGTPGVPIVPVASGQATSNHNNLLTSMMLMDESIIIQPQFQQLEINGKQPASGEGGMAAAGYGTVIPQKERRRRNSSNSKHDLMSPCKPTNGSISPSATHSRFSTPGARSLPLTPPSVPYAADRPPVATFSCPDGLAHALSEQNLRLQQIVYEHRLREEALQRELYATRLALLKKTCQHCCSSSAQPQYGNEDPVPVSISITSVAALTATASTSSSVTMTGNRIGRETDRNHRDGAHSHSSSRSSSGGGSMSTVTSIRSTTAATTTTAATEHLCSMETWMGSSSIYGLLSGHVHEDGKALLVFSDEEEEEEEEVSGSGVAEQQERCLCEAILKHNRRFAQNVRMWRTVRQFLERTRQKRMDYSSRASLKPLTESFPLEDPISEYYADSDDDDNEKKSSGSSDIFDGSSDIDIARENRTVRRTLTDSTDSIRYRGAAEMQVDGSGDSGGGGGGGVSDEDEKDDADAELSSQLVSDAFCITLYRFTACIVVCMGLISSSLCCAITNKSMMCYPF